jgi:hypothetical protein
MFILDLLSYAASALWFVSLVLPVLAILASMASARLLVWLAGGAGAPAAFAGNAAGLAAGLVAVYDAVFVSQRGLVVASACVALTAANLAGLAAPIARLSRAAGLVAPARRAPLVLSGTSAVAPSAAPPGGGPPAPVFDALAAAAT